MNGNKKPARTSPRHQPQIKQEVAISLEPPQESNYNPHTAKDGPAAKLWELLRRNPMFREEVQRLINEADSVDFKGEKNRTVAQKLSQIDFDHFIAGYVLHWIFEPEFMDFGDIHDYFPDGFKSGRKYVQSVLPYLDPEESVEIEKLGFSKFCAEFPFYLRRDIHVFQWDEYRREHGHESSPILGPLWDEEKRNDYPGKLQLNKGNFNLDTPWPKTPNLFKRQFQWLWAHYDINVTSPFTDDRKYFPALRSAEWLFDGSEERSMQVDYFKLNYELIGVPINCLYSEKNLDELVRRFREYLEIQLKWKFAFVAGSHLKSTQKYPHLLGGQLDWEVFISCFPQLEFLPDSGSKAHWLGSPKALRQFAEQRTASGKKGKEESHISESLDRMLTFTNKVFPTFKFETLTS